MIHQWPDNGHDTRDAAPVSLTREQRWDLAGIFGAGLMSSVVIVAAAILPNPDGAPDPVPDPAPVHAGASAPPTVVPALTRSAPAVALAPAPIAPKVSTSELRDDVAPQPRVARLEEPARPIRATDQGDDPVSRKLTRFLTGDGRHTVRPFPTIDEGGR